MGLFSQLLECYWAGMGGSESARCFITTLRAQLPLTTARLVMAHAASKMVSRAVALMCCGCSAATSTGTAPAAGAGQGGGGSASGGDGGTACRLRLLRRAGGAAGRGHSRGASAHGRAGRCCCCCCCCCCACQAPRHSCKASLAVHATQSASIEPANKLPWPHSNSSAAPNPPATASLKGGSS